MDYQAPDYKTVLTDRAHRLQGLRERPELLPRVRAHYRDNIADFISDWGMTADPRNAERGLPVVVPFVLFDRQREWVDWLIERWHGQESGLTEKSRDMGVSWLSIAAACSICLFNRDLNIGFGSRKEEYVDKIGDPKSLFYKARQFMELLPKEFKGDWTQKSHTSHMVIRFGNGSTLTGEAGTNIGRGNRTAIYFKDESAFYEQPELIDAALSQTSNCKIDISTPNGAGNPFYKKRHGGKIPVFTFHWKDDPRKDQAWYEKQCDELDAVTVAQEIDIDYTASIEGVCIPARWIRAAVNLHETMGLLPSGETRIGFDVADEEGKDDNAVCVVTWTVVEAIESWNGKDTHQSTAIASQFARDHRAMYINFDSIGVGAGVRAAGKLSGLNFMPVAVSESPTPGSVMNMPERLNKDFYLNLRAQLWWEMRIRFERAYQHVNDIKKWSLDDMISIPNRAELISELSQPLVEYTDSGKVKIESKKAMKRRGIPSPNEAEALLLAFVPKRQVVAARPTRVADAAGWT